MHFFLCVPVVLLDYCFQFSVDNFYIVLRKKMLTGACLFVLRFLSRSRRYILFQSRVPFFDTTLTGIARCTRAMSNAKNSLHQSIAEWAKVGAGGTHFSI